MRCSCPSMTSSTASPGHWPAGSVTDSVASDGTANDSMASDGMANDTALPGTGWPEDPATPDTPVAGTRDEVAALAASAATLAELTARQSVCQACPRLVQWRRDVAVTRRKSFRDERYWGRPIPGWGDPAPRILIVGLAPAAHGGNRTGRIFTGD